MCPFETQEIPRILYRHIVDVFILRCRPRTFDVEYIKRVIHMVPYVRRSYLFIVFTHLVFQLNVELFTSMR